MLMLECFHFPFAAFPVATRSDASHSTAQQAGKSRRRKFSAAFGVSLICPIGGRARRQIGFVGGEHVHGKLIRLMPMPSEIGTELSSSEFGVGNDL